MLKIFIDSNTNSLDTRTTIQRNEYHIFNRPTERLNFLFFCVWLYSIINNICTSLLTRHVHERNVFNDDAFLTSHVGNNDHLSWPLFPFLNSVRVQTLRNYICLHTIDAFHVVLTTKPLSFPYHLSLTPLCNWRGLFSVWARSVIFVYEYVI